jgi:hypothetical protein
MPIDGKARDDFLMGTRELLAKRVGYKCSNPNCGQATSGPQTDPTRAINIGVAAHVSGASPGGPRYDASLSSEARADAANGIWLCQNCAKLVDNDTERYTIAILAEWKRIAEQAALRSLEATKSSRGGREEGFSKIERLMPKLLSEMRKDAAKFPVVREFIALKKGLVFWYPDRPMFTYYYEDHEDLDGKLQILENLRFIRNIKYNNVPRFVIEEEFADYLSG